MIKFLCPNGHQLSAPDNLAGKSGKCPKCSTAFMVPTLEELAQADVGAAEDPAAADLNPPGSEPAAGQPPAEKSGVGKAAAAAGNSGVVGGSRIGEGSSTGQASNVFVFLCPNGHKLNGPPSLKGKPGQCPHCGARFVIPEDDEVPPDDDISGGFQDEDDIPAGEAVEDDMSVPEAEVEVEEAEPDPEPIPPGVHSLGYIVGRLWDHKSETTELEIFLSEGEILSPDHYAEILSTGDYGVFAHREAEDDYSLTVIPWSSIRRVDLRKVPRLSPGTFR